MAGGKITAIAEKEIYLRTHADLHVILLNLQIVPIMQNLNGHKSLHGIIGVSINIKQFKHKYYKLKNFLKFHKLYKFSHIGYYFTGIKAREIRYK